MARWGAASGRGGPFVRRRQVSVSAPVCGVDPGVMDGRSEPGGSIEREYQRRKAVREQRARQKHPRIGGLLVRLNPEPQHQRAFQTGARGERTVAASLERCASEGSLRVLHNRRVPGARGDIDHIAIAATGVYVIDTKAVRGRVRIERPLFGAPRLLINGRDQTKYLDGLDRQVAAVRAALSRDAAAQPSEHVPVQGLLCFTEADLPGWRSAKLRGHLLVYQRALRKRLKAEGPWSATLIEAIASRLEAALPPA